MKQDKSYRKINNKKQMSLSLEEKWRLKKYKVWRRIMNAQESCMKCKLNQKKTTTGIVNCIDEWVRTYILSL